MIKALRRRDFKENELAGQELAMHSCEVKKQEFKAKFDDALAKYQKWKKDNKLEGIRY